MEKKIIFFVLCSIVHLSCVIATPRDRSKFINPKFFKRNVVMKKNLKVEESVQIKSLGFGFGAVVGVIDSDGTLGFLPSSGRYKSTIRSIDDATNKVMQLRPVTFIYKGDESKKMQYGFIAEEVAKVAPELVVYSGDNQPLTVRYGSLAPMLLHELQKQVKKIEDINQRMGDQEAQHNVQTVALIDRIAQLEQKITELEKKN